MRNTPAQAVNLIAAAAGWRPAAADSSGSRHYSFEGGLSLTIDSPDENTLIFWALLETLPTDSEAAKTERLDKIGRLTAGILTQRASIVSLEENRLILWRRISTDAAEAVLLKETRDFLNDEAWWKARLKEEPVSSGPFFNGFFPSPFTF